MSRTDVVQTSSIEEEDPNTHPEKKQKSRKPPNTAFRQQRLKAWQPILTPKTVIPIFYAVGLLFALFGGLLLWASFTVQELIIDYTDCREAGAQTVDVPSDRFSASFKTSNYTHPQWSNHKRTVRPGPFSGSGVTLPTNTCTIQFDIPNDIGPPVLLYYRLTNFYQNHRRYVKSLDTDQLKGNFISNSSISSSACDPLKLAPNGKAYYPCGLIANSIFNDTIHSPKGVNAGGSNSPESYTMTSKGIAWDTDATLYKKTKYTNDQVYPPPNWENRYPGGYNDDQPIPDLSTYEEFQVWMRTAGLPTFSKLALRNDNDVMPAGIYTIDIDDFFPVTEYSGRKSILISTRTVVGGKNNFLGIAYLVVGGLLLLLGVVFTVLEMIMPRKLGDHTYLSWNNDRGNGATTGASTGGGLRSRFGRRS